jgi:ribosomal protein S18 acetylase RimI-like enzyme
MTAAPVRHEIRQMTAADVDEIAAVMARAFFDDPLQVWLFPDAGARLDTLRRMFALQIRYGSVPLGESYTDSTCACAAFWLPPGRWQPDESPMDGMHPLAEIVGAAIGRLQAAYRVMVSAHPVEPHFYLSGVGTDPPRQGAGLGSAVLAPVLGRCDQDGIAAYLESTKERNIRFYEHHGFDVTGTIAPEPDGPLMWCMWRDPQRAIAR